MAERKSRLRLGVIGAGRIAQVAHLPALAKVSGIELVGISDPSPTLAHGVAGRYVIAGFTDTRELLGQDLHAVLIAAPDRLHHPLGRMALESGKHVLMEKPLASTSVQARELADLAAEHGVKLQVGAMKRHDPGMAFARDHLPRIGRLLSVSSWYRVMSALRPPTEAALFPPLIVDPEVRRVEDTFKAERERYLLATHGAHLFDGLIHLAGPLSWVSARAGNAGADYTWHGMAGMRDTDGLISFEISAAVHGEWSEGMDIYGEYGHISTRSHFPFFRRASDVEVHIEREGVSVRPHFGDTDAFKLQAERFVRSVLDDTPENPTPADGVAAVTLIEAVAASAARDGAAVQLG